MCGVVWSKSARLRLMIEGPSCLGAMWICNIVECSAIVERSAFRITLAGTSCHRVSNILEQSDELCPAM